jgi:hypothetical protein
VRLLQGFFKEISANAVTGFLDKNLPKTCQKPAKNLPKTCQKPAKNLPKTCAKPGLTLTVQQPQTGFINF